ncbi:MAG: flagellar basal body rod protein FlgB [Rhodospirillaceae bacterium]|nr:flagellar basal body rod protein FlgB [Rhodospirillaceae bacterium]
MDIGNLTLFSMLRRNLDYQSQRQRVVAENIANADTPGYRPNDLPSFAEVLEDSGMGRLAPVQTNSRHLTGARAGAPNARGMDDIYEASPSGNEVVLEQQLIALNEVSANHQLSLRLIERHLGMLRTALGNS